MTAQKLVNSLLENLLRPHQKEVVVGRFGLEKSGQSKTLAAIGEKLGLTRERVRQIEKLALETLSKAIKKNPAVLEAVGRIVKQLRSAGGVLGADVFVGAHRKFALGATHGQLQLLAEASQSFHFSPEDENLKSFYYLSHSDRKAAQSFVHDWIVFLSNSKKETLEKGYGERLKRFIKSKRLGRVAAENFLSIAKGICRSPYGDMGLVSWPEVRPVAAKDRAYLILRMGGQPLHFEDITAKINRAGFDARVALAATVHNELIKDSRFVLVGRGTYSLREQGYEPGFAKDVIKNVLEKHGPLRSREVIERVSKQRLFKSNTVIINLQNKNYFERLADGRYRVREA